METQHENAHAPVAPAANAETFIKRELNGATFLTLEHIGHMALVVLVPLLILAGLESALSMWTGTTGMTSMMFGNSSLLATGGSKVYEAAVALGVVAALIVLLPALYILDRRTRAEWHKRPAYAARLAYKAPLYIALGSLIAIMITIKIELLYIIVASLAFIGVSGASIGSLYLTSFLPLLGVYVVVAGTAWYLFKLAKGQDYGRKFGLGIAALGTATVVALFITSVVTLHSSGSLSAPAASSSPSSDTTYDSQYYQDLLNKYSQ